MLSAFTPGIVVIVAFAFIVIAVMGLVVALARRK
jgi:hypothetical protein